MSVQVSTAPARATSDPEVAAFLDVSVASVRALALVELE
jgi:hypothetical protein